ncbi:MAG: hypothetical protein AAF415_05045 [Pseudomonadota bacterium]
MMDPDGETSPRTRFLLRTQRWVRVWFWCLVVALTLGVIGIWPSAIAAIALLGIAWVPIMVLVFWGNWLDEIINPHADQDEGPW